MLENLRVWLVLKLFGNELGLLDTFNQQQSRKLKSLEKEVAVLREELRFFQDFLQDPDNMLDSGYEIN